MTLTTLMLPRTRHEQAMAVILASVSTGLLSVALADNMGATATPGADVAFWVGILLIFVPVVGQVVLGSPTRTEMWLLVGLVALALYLVKVFHSPYYFTFPDEFMHLRTVNDIVQTGRLFSPNPLLPVSPFYPVLEIVTAGVADAANVPVFVAGIVVMAGARILEVGALLVLLRTILGSERLAAIGCLVYMTHPNFVFFDATFKYATVALPIATVLLLSILMWTRAQPNRRRRWFVVSVALVALVAVSHHLTLLAVIGFLCLWSAAVPLLRALGRRPPTASPWPLLIVAVVALAVTWLLVAPSTINYLAPVVARAFTTLGAFISGALGAVTPSGGRDVFNSTGVRDAPQWERLVAIMSVVVILTLSLLGIARTRLAHFGRPIMVALAAAVALYPGALLLRLTGASWEVGNRASEFLYLGIASLAAVGTFVASSLAVRRHKRMATAAVAVASAAVIVGGVFSGWPYEWRLPREYTAGDTGPPAIDASRLGVSRWLLENIGPNQRVAADPINHMILGSVGEQWSMTTLSGGIDPYWVILSPVIDDDKRALLRDGRVKYLVVDDRLLAQPQLFDKYFPGTGDSLEAREQALAKFDVAPIDRVFDNGQIKIYDVSALWASS